ncbi:MAG: transglutaminase domain-containing protein [Pseudomonadota bacterium]
MSRTLLATLLFVLGCTTPIRTPRVSASASAPAPDIDDPAARAAHIAPALDGYSATYVLLWKGARIGEAHERFAAHPQDANRYHFQRLEHIVVKRGGTRVATETVVEVDTDAMLTPTQVIVSYQTEGVRTQAEAVRLPDRSWLVTHPGRPQRIVSGAAIPSTLMPLLVVGRTRTPGRVFEGPVLIEGAGLALVQVSVELHDDHRSLSAAIYSPTAELHARALLDQRGRIVEAGDPQGVTSRLASRDELAESFDPPEIVQASAIMVDGEPVGDDRLHLLVKNVRKAPPNIAEIPDQAIIAQKDVPNGSWEVRVDPPAIPTSGFAFEEVRERTSFVARSLEDDLRAPGLTLVPEVLLSMGRGDCTAHALVLAKLLENKGYEAKLVTGLLLEGNVLLRHRWVTVRIGEHWVAVDPTLDEVPASPTRLALAVHGASPDEVAFIDDATFAGWERAVVQYWRE